MSQSILKIMSNKKEEYGESLKDPRWQKKRFDILNRDNWTCQICGSKEKTLHVHHLCYDKNKNPWEYDEMSLITLCEGCHKLEHDINFREIIAIFGQNGYTKFELYSVLAMFANMCSRSDEIIVEMSKLPNMNEVLNLPLDIFTRLSERREKVREIMMKNNHDLH